MSIETSIKRDVAERAAHRFVENNRFTLQSLASDLDLKPAEIYQLFPNRSSILDYYYVSRFELYQEQISAIENYENYSLSEKLSTLILSLLDQFTEQREFVLETYRRRVLNPTSSSKFRELYIREMKTIFNSDLKLCSASSFLLNSLFYSALFQTFNGILWFWSNDRSDLSENSMALVDKWSSFTEELFYTKVAEKGVDLGKFILMNSPIHNFIRF